jgi:hypothetical protein
MLVSFLNRIFESANRRHGRHWRRPAWMPHFNLVEASNNAIRRKRNRQFCIAQMRTVLPI